MSQSANHLYILLIVVRCDIYHYLALVFLSNCFSSEVIVSKPAALCSAELSWVRLPSSAILPAKSGCNLSTPSLPSSRKKLNGNIRSQSWKRGLDFVE